MGIPAQLQPLYFVHDKLEKIVFNSVNRPEMAEASVLGNKGRVVPYSIGLSTITNLKKSIFNFNPANYCC